jgi:MFS family permease
VTDKAHSMDNPKGLSTLIGVNVLWLPLSMLYNSLQSLILPVIVLRFVAPGAKASALGFLLFAGLAAGALVQPLAGIYSDRLRPSRGGRILRWGRRTPLIVVGTFLALAFLAGMTLASNLITLAIVYVGISLTAGIVQAGAQGLLPDLVGQDRRGAASGLKGTLELSGSLLGFAVAGALIKQGHPTAALLTMGVLLAIGMLLTCALVREGRATIPATDGSLLDSPPAGPVSTIAHNASHERLDAESATPQHAGAFARVLISRFLFLLGVYGVGHFLLYYVGDRLHMSNPVATVGGLLSLLTLITAAFAMAGGLLSDRVGRQPVLVAAAVLSAAGVLVFIPANSLGAIMLGGAIMGVGSGLFASANWALTADMTPAGAGGRFFGLLALATGGAAALAGLFGPLVDHAGYTPLFVVAAVAYCASVAVLPRTAPIAAMSRTVAVS